MQKLPVDGDGAVERILKLPQFRKAWEDIGQGVQGTESDMAAIYDMIGESQWHYRRIVESVDEIAVLALDFAEAPKGSRATEKRRVKETFDEITHKVTVVSSAFFLMGLMVGFLMHCQDTEPPVLQ